jgi:predicted transcriptional regulator of viral defense system
VPSELITSLDGLAAHQGGVLSRQQALELGLSYEAIRQRLRTGRWQRIHPGVYACFSATIGRQSLLWAAVLHAGRGSALSHETAAQLNGLPGSERAVIHLSVPVDRHLWQAPGLVIHRTHRVVSATHPARVPPRTRIEETVLDLTQTSRTFDEAFGWLCRACAERLTTAQHIKDAMALRKKMRWRTDISGALSEVATGIHSPLERRYVRDVERPHGLPTAQRQAASMSAGRTEYRDHFYQDYGVAVETDGAAAHPQSARWRDIARDNAAAVTGIITLRYSWSDVTARPCDVAGQVAAVLRIRGWPGSPTRCRPDCPVMTAFSSGNMRR